jgi:midasin
VLPSHSCCPVLTTSDKSAWQRYAADLLLSISSTTPPLVEADLSPRIALIADSITLRTINPASTSIYSIIHVPTTAITTATRSILSHLQLGIPTLITSPPSSGKTHILQYLSTQIHPSHQPTHRILTIPLADTTIDVKSLIGTYVSSPTKPGTFEWMEGALAKAVRAGRWVVFEDIDRASTEMLVTVSGLARSLKIGKPGRRGKLAVPGREEIEAGDGFAMFATRTVRQGGSTPPTFFGHHNLSEVTLEAPTDDDILAILSARFQTLPKGVMLALVDIWQQLRPLAKTGGQVKGRDIGLRDLEKWCARVERNLPPAASLAALERSGAGTFANPVFQDEILLEAADTFIAPLDSKPASLEKKARMVSIIAERIGMDEERAMTLLDGRKPQLEISTGAKHLRIGRATIDIAPAERRRKVASDRPFALTKPSLVLLERIAATATMGEPTLLVGETGTGKTTAVQYLATTSRKPLTVLNLSTQTESSDLLGGFKPIDASVTARSLHSRWQKLFCEAFSMAKAQNGSYLEAASKALNGRKWGRCADLWSTSARRALDKLAKKDDGYVYSRAASTELMITAPSRFLSSPMQLERGERSLEAKLPRLLSSGNLYWLTSQTSICITSR